MSPAVATITSTEDATEIRPLLKWAGGKRWLVPRLQAFWKSHNSRRLVEPFAGGLAVSLGLLPRSALLNDINPHLINFYRWVKKGLKLSESFKNDRRYYDEQRARFNQLIASKKTETDEAAQIFYYLNRTGYNGLCRFNSHGFYNVPFGRHKKINYRENFSNHEKYFKKWTFQCKDFEELPIVAGDFVYADPPYDVPFTNYSKDGFNWHDQERLVEWLKDHKGPIILSNQATDRVKDLYREFGYKAVFVKGPRFISCDGNRKKANEILAYKNLE